MKKRPKLFIGKIVILLVFMSVFFSGCKEDTPVNVTVEDTVDITDEVLVDNTESNEESVDEGVVESENPDESETDESALNTDENKEADNSQSTTTESKEDNKDTEEDIDTSTGANEPEEIPKSLVEEEENLPVEPEPAPPLVDPNIPAEYVPSVHWDGSGVTLQTLGLTIPTLRDFNDEALTDNTNNTFWTGDNNDIPAAQVLADTLNAVRDATISAGIIGEHSQGFALEQYRIIWSYTSYSSVNDIMLYRNPLNRTYTLYVNCALDTDIFGIHDVAPYSRDVLITICTIFSSQPQTIYDYIYKGIHEDASVLYSKSFADVGDCKIRLDNEKSWVSSETGSFSIVFEIKAK